ncbi:hypothetical protein HD597_002539 [Nonomuraea thailandensis]|uniref:Uncharacterized protein n=1 Tax=Nonomuraea thailandensis TaxID=1188745 RepID=A0A9X2GDQ3_9ACTN|nr:hypothetical protein [Nonomuraea thailandensis]MCP2355519.1 hypothetical protein [Nonomuraea thailandensis]
MIARRHTRALLTAAVAAALGVVINVATDLGDNVWAWASVLALTLVSGTVAAAVEGRPAGGGRTVVIRTGGWRSWLSGTRQRTEIEGIVLVIEVETRPDGSRLKRTTVYSEEVAMKLTGLGERETEG